MGDKKVELLRIVTFNIREVFWIHLYFLEQVFEHVIAVHDLKPIMAEGRTELSIEPEDFIRHE